MQPEVRDEETEWEETSTRADARTEHHTREVGCVQLPYRQGLTLPGADEDVCMCVCVSTNST